MLLEQSLDWLLPEQLRGSLLELWGRVERPVKVCEKKLAAGMGLKAV